MSDWISQYAASLQARDAREQAHKQYIDAYTRLADKTSSSTSTGTTKPVTEPVVESQPQPPQRTSILSNPIRLPSRSTPPPPQPAAQDEPSSLRADLAGAQKARATLAATLKDTEAQLAQLQAERKEAQAQISSLTRAKLDTERKLRDRDSELKGKASIVNQVQDEMVSMEIQLNLAEEKAEKLKRENKELVDRWMRKMGEEAEKVNRESSWT